MSQIPSVRFIRDSILEQARQPTRDEVALEGIRNDVVACVRGIRRAIDRASDFANRGLISEAAGLVEDFPNLAMQAQALIQLPSSDRAVQQIWNDHIDTDAIPLPMPTMDEVERVASFVSRAEEHRNLLDALRVAVLRAEPTSARLKILRRLRAADPRNRMWLDQIESVEQQWLKSIAELRTKQNPNREELDDALVALEANEWIASVPRGLKEEIYAVVKPLRAAEAVGRYAELVAKIHIASARMDREEMVELEQAWAKVNHETGRMPDEDQAAAVASAFEWLNRLDQEDRAQREFEQMVEQLERLLTDGRPAIEIERQISVLNDAGRPAPEGLMERAYSYIQAERDRVRRRHRFVMFAAVLAAGVVVAGTFFAIRASSEARRRQDELSSLQKFLNDKDVVKAHALAEEIRARGDADGAEMAAALALEATQFEAREKRAADIHSTLERVLAELNRNPSRARLLALKEDLVGARIDADDAEIREIDKAEKLRGEKLVALDEQADKLVTSTLAAIDAELATWKLPPNWTDEEQLDPEQWKRYARALESALAKIAELRTATEGYELGGARIKTKSDGVEARQTEAKQRSEALALALKELSPAQLCGLITVEADFAKRLDHCLSAHGSILARQNRLADFEASKDLVSAWAAVQAWREDYLPKLTAKLGADLSGTVEPEAATEIRESLQEFNTKFPQNSMYTRIEELAAKFDMTNAAERWLPERVGLALVDARLADLEEVPLVRNRRFYRRPPTIPAPPPEQLRPLNRAVKNLADVVSDPEKLSSILAVRPEEIVGKPEPSEISLVWKAAQGRLEHAELHDVQPILLDLLGKIRGASKEEPLFRLRALIEATSAFLQSGSASPQITTELKRWQASVNADAAQAKIADWALAGYDDPVNFRKAVVEAESAIRQFPDVKRVLEQALLEQTNAAKALHALAPLGILAPAGSVGKPREVVGTNESGTFVVFVKHGVKAEMVDVTVNSGKVQVVPAGLSKGPVIIFRRVKS